MFVERYMREHGNYLDGMGTLETRGEFLAV
jgi:hypothetical protein